MRNSKVSAGENRASYPRKLFYGVAASFREFDRSNGPSRADAQGIAFEIVIPLYPFFLSFFFVFFFFMDPGKYEIFLSFPPEFPPLSVYMYIYTYVYKGLYRLGSTSSRSDSLAS